ncbi:MFS transporter [Candidatus Woesearchaeota archaeon]|nr:MFS transporter [Candidatus Woesearchaeota archaeon]
MFVNTKSKIFIPTVVSTIFRFLFYMTLPLLSIYFKEVIHMSDQLLGIVSSFFPLVVIVFSPIIGQLSDAVGRKRIIYLGVLAQFLAVFLYLYPATVLSAVIGRILSGFGWMMVVLITLAKVHDKLKGRERGKKSGVFLGISWIGSLLGPLIGSFLAYAFFLRFPFVLSLIGLALLLIWLFVWKSHHKPVVHKQDFNPFYALKKYFAEKKLRAMALIGIAMHTRVAVVEIFLPLIILSLGAGLKEVGILFFLRGFAHLFQGFAGRITDKKGSKNVVILSVIASSVLIIIAGFTKSYIPLLIFMCLEGFALAFWNVSAWTFMSEIGIRKKMEGVVVGSYTSIAKTGHFVFALISGFLVVVFGMTPLLIITGAISLVTVLLVAPMLASKYKILNRDVKR